MLSRRIFPLQVAASPDSRLDLNQTALPVVPRWDSQPATQERTEETLRVVDTSVPQWDRSGDRLTHQFTEYLLKVSRRVELDNQLSGLLPRICLYHLDL